MDSNQDNRPPKPSISKLGGAAMGLLQGHIELIGIEFQEEKSRTFRLFICCAVALFFGLLLLICLSATIMILCWENHRMSAAIGLCLFYGLGLLLAALQAGKLAGQMRSPFEATLEELNRNRERLLP